MNSNISRLIMLNQMAGPLFRELAEDLAPLYEAGCILVTGHPDTLAREVDKESKLIIRAAPVYNRSSNFHRLISWFSYILFVSKILIRANKGDAVLFVSNPPILGGWVWLLTRLNKIPYAVLVYDIYPDVLIKLGLLRQNSFLVKLWRAINKLVYNNSKLIITIGNRMAKTLKSQLPESRQDIVTVPPWVDVKGIKPLTLNENPHAHYFVETSDDFIVLYSGNMGASHDIDSMLEASLILKNRTDIKFIFIGEGEKFNDIKRFINNYNLKNATLFPFQPESMVKYTMALADISLVSLDQGMEELMIPSKSFYYLAAGSALIAIANDKSELSDLLEQINCGKRVPPGKPYALASAIKELASNPQHLSIMKKNARELAENRYSREVCTNEFSESLKRSKLL